MTKVVIVNPRAMYFGDRHATSIDLTVRDLILHSRFRDDVTVIGDPIDLPFDGIAYVARPMGHSDRFFFRMRRLLATIRAMAPDVVSVQEHLGTASYLAKHLKAPVVLHLHNPIRQPKNPIERRWRGNAFVPLSGLIFVSRDHERSFRDTWPSVTTPRFVVPNGLDLAQWHPAASREKVVLVVGRAVPEKGILEAAEALAATLPRHPDWRTVFILSAVTSHPDYVADIHRVLAPLGQQAELLTGQPFTVVRDWSEKAAIAVVSSHMMVGSSTGWVAGSVCTWMPRRKQASLPPSHLAMRARRKSGSSAGTGASEGVSAAPEAQSTGRALNLVYWSPSR